MVSRPRNIGIRNLMHFRFPLTAITSVLHRASGVLLVLSIPFLVWLLQYSLSTEAHFIQIKNHFDCPVMRFIFWVFLSALAYHLVAGIKHLLLDWGFFETKRSGKISSFLVILISVILIIGLGAWLWAVG